MPRITQPGKFEGEETYVPYFWDMVLEGFHEEVGRGDSSVARIEISNEDRAKFPALGNAKYILLEESDQGFVYSRLSGRVAKAKKWPKMTPERARKIAGEANRAFMEYEPDSRREVTAKEILGPIGHRRRR